MSIADTATALVTVFLAELPDKTMVATIMLVARYRHPFAVWIGTTAAFALHVTVAVVAGNLLSRVPERAVDGIVLLLFTGGAVAMGLAARRSAGGDGLDAGTDAGEPPARVPLLRVLVGSFAFVALAEWGDLTQITTAGLAARSNSAVSTWIGALSALAAVAGIAAVLGRRLIERLPLRRIQFVAAVVFAALAGWTLLELVAAG